MEGSGVFKKWLPAGFGALAAVILAISCYQVMIAGPLEPVLRDRYTVYMMAEVLALFLWNLLWLSMTGRRRLQGAGVLAGILAFTWCHQIILPVIVSGLYMALLVVMGRWVLRLFFREHGLPFGEELSMALVLGSALWMTVVCLVSLTGHGGLILWRLIAGGFALAAAAGEAWRLRRRAAGSSGSKGAGGGIVRMIWLPEKRTQAWLLAFVITMLLIQAGRMNIELDYDSLHYGLRSAFVLDNGRGIYENLGMNNLVYTYSKGLEVLLLPLSGTPTYGFVLAFSLWAAIGVLLLICHMVSRHRGRDRGLLAAALAAAVPGIMNMTATAKSDMITLLHQLIIYNFLTWAFYRGKKEEGTPWILMAVSAYLLTMVYKPTALVFSTALGGVALVCLVLTRRFTLGSRKGWLMLLLPAGAVTGLWYRTFLMTGVPVTSIFAAFFERIGFGVKYPFTFTHVIGNPDALSTGEKLARLASRLGEMLLAPVSGDMGHVIIAWGSGLVTFLLFVWVLAARRAAGGAGVKAWNAFDRMLLPVLALGSVVSIYTLSQVDGNYFILFYGLLIVSSVRMMEFGGAGAEGQISPASEAKTESVNLQSKAGTEFANRELKAGSEAGYGSGYGSGFGPSPGSEAKCPTGGKGLYHAEQLKLCMLLAPFLISSVPLTCATGWSGDPGFTPPKLMHMGFYNHREAEEQRRISEGSSNLALSFFPWNRVLAFGEHPRVLDLPCSVQSYYDVTGSGGNVYLVKKLAYFKEFLQYAGTEYFFVEAGYLADQPRALEIIEDMIAEGSLSDLRYEWGNMAGRVTLGGSGPENPEQAVAQFLENYSMTPND